MQSIRVLIIDDEARLRSKLKKLLLLITDRVEIIGEADSVESGVAAILQQMPDLVFLDVEMGDGTGFDVLAGVGAQRRSFEVVFATAFTQYTMDAIKQYALHYLVKPFAQQDLKDVMERVHARFDEIARLRGETGRTASHTVPSVPATLPASAVPAIPHTLSVADGNVRYYIPTDQIVYCEAAQNYSMVYITETARKQYQISAAYLTIRKNIGELTAKLEPAGFIRIHRSHCINKRFVSKVVHEGTTHIAVIDPTLEMYSGTSATVSHANQRSLQRLPISDAYYAEFVAQME
jgi:two-component system LytT family response regulator